MHGGRASPILRETRAYTPHQNSAMRMDGVRGRKRTASLGCETFGKQLLTGKTISKDGTPPREREAHHTRSMHASDRTHAIRCL
ncbi:hypothetical protein NDU88_002402 [Pleurodeles waltl]|uniref:Uncharacterized protein n=1 Tax=Pleurodeles waltl TaxID=8319 RepID=A0AAV7UD38_PLEWA|nr:hypothetical protein NDU88_002402 [Pleurodeles waltl]